MAPLIPTLLLALAAAAFALAAFLRRRSSALSSGTLVYSDTHRRTVTEPITSHRLQLSGKPDYVYRLSELAVPVEVKQHRAGRFGPRERDVMQLLTYCVLLEDVWGATVTHGLLEYSDRRFTISYGPAQRRKVLELAEEIRAYRMVADVSRSHREAWKCRRCGYNKACGQALSRN